ncbi:unnamed protein product [Allacma fusca]|uniref:CUB domain-containing protein n=1 Tax=Allacma fusca TaxID=39272 RepID=A0A8J2J368_9HEXA|nr:unnamed protein product [Allacma fusca]
MYAQYHFIKTDLSIRSQPKILSNEICNHDSFTGICLNSTECEKRGGTSNEQCWNNDVCCNITARCPSNSNPCVIRHSGTTVVSENAASDYRRTYRFMKAENICQLRLDFDEFELAQPDERANCNNDLMQVISPRAGFGICGSNSQQHIYLNYDSRSYIDINMRIRSTDAKYRIRSTFIECGSETLAPVNCLQYFADLDGTVKSFNSGHQQLNNLEYSICVASYEGVSKIQWKQCEDTSLHISGSGLSMGPMSSPQCRRDWLQIYGQDRYCGRGFNTITSSAQPFLLNVHFDEGEGFGVSPPTDPSQCNGQTITDPYTGGTFICRPIDGAACQCDFVPPSPDFNITNDIDVNNTGFCLNYEQMW